MIPWIMWDKPRQPLTARNTHMNPFSPISLPISSLNFLAPRYIYTYLSYLIIQRTSIPSSYTLYISCIWAVQAAAILTNKIFSNASTCFSNVVGPREEIEFYGHPIAFIAPTCYGQPSVRTSYIYHLINFHFYLYKSLASLHYIVTLYIALLSSDLIYII